SNQRHSYHFLSVPLCKYLNPSISISCTYVDLYFAVITSPPATFSLISISFRQDRRSMDIRPSCLSMQSFKFFDLQIQNLLGNLLFQHFRAFLMPFTNILDYWQ